MKFSTKIAFFLFCLLFLFGGIELFARYKIHTTPAKQALARYKPTDINHAVFLGSSLTDAGIQTQLFDSLRQDEPNKLQAFNLALAGMSGTANYYILYKNFIRAHGNPKYLVLENLGNNFFPPEASFDLEGGYLRVQGFRSELIDYQDFIYLSKGFPGISESISFWLHKHWRSYHMRIELQARIHEIIANHISKPTPKTPNQIGHYNMKSDAVERFRTNAKNDVNRLQHSSYKNYGLELRDVHLLDLAALTKSAGTQLVVLRPPCPPFDEVFQNSLVYQTFESSLKKICDSLNVIYIDLHKSNGNGDYSFLDGIHLNRAGAKVYTKSVSESLP